MAQAPVVANPTSVAAAADGTVFIGQSGTEKNGTIGIGGGSVHILKAGQSRLLADGLNTVSGMECIGDNLYVLHPPRLSAFRITGTEGRGYERFELVNGLGPAAVATQGINKHLAAGLRAGIDGALYMAVGDEGIPRLSERTGGALCFREEA